MFIKITLLTSIYNVMGGNFSWLNVQIFNFLWSPSFGRKIFSISLIQIFGLLKSNTQVKDIYIYILEHIYENLPGVW